jgi:ATP/maltotriose-dependent transcriptional regulator MalT
VALLREADASLRLHAATATLARPRLLDWLRAKIHGRVVLLLADAGYGKTTLLADFSRRTRTRTLWYRLDPDDRDWITILNHLVAAGREHDAEFAPETAALLGRVGAPEPPAMDAVLDTFVGELSSIAGGGAVLIFDDFHLVDDAPDARHIARELVARAPERFTVVFASSAPTTSASMPPRPRSSSPKHTVGSSRPMSSPTSRHAPRDGSRPSSWSRRRCATDRRPRSAASSGR